VIFFFREIVVEPLLLVGLRRISFRHFLGRDFLALKRIISCAWSFMKSIFEAKGLLGLGAAFIVGLPDPFHLKIELQAAESIKLATAFAHWSGWRHLLPDIKKTKGTVKLLTGLSFCQTEPRVLYDWYERSRDGRIKARLFADKCTTFHPKVLLVKSSRKAFAVVGSGNLSDGGFVKNIECGLFSDDPNVYSSLDGWFERLFSDDTLTKQLREPDIRSYKRRYDAAKKANREVEQLQQEAEEDIGERHRAGLRQWKRAIGRAKTFFASAPFKKKYAVDRASVAKKIKRAVHYPTFDFDYVGLEKFYKIRGLGHLIEIAKANVWKRRKRLQAGLRFLIDDSNPIEERLDAVLSGRYKVEGVSENFLTKVLAVHNPLKFTVWNDAIKRALGDFGYEHTRGLSKAQKYLEFAELMERFLKESGARSTLELDAFFFEHYDKHVKERH
jgi:HKD family nuclease